MAGIVIIVLLLLYFFGYVQIPGFVIPNPALFSFNGNPVLLSTLLIFLAIMWAIGILPSPLRQIAMVFYVLWILSILGIISIAGLNHVFVGAILIGLVISLF